MTPDPSADVALRLSEQRIVAALRGRRSLSRAALAEWTGLPRTTVVAAVAGLLRRSLLVEHDEPGDGPRSVGRPAAVLSLAHPGGPVALVSFDRTGATIALGDYAGGVVGRRPLDVASDDESDTVLPAVQTALAELATEAGCEAASFAVVGLPLPFERGRGAHRIRRITPSMLATFPNLQPLPDWLRSDPSAAFSDALGIPVIAENDANLAALGEAHYGAARRCSGAVYVAIRNGLGVGLVLDGRLHRGATGVAGELAHVSVQDDGALCLCGGRGCLATVYRNGPLLIDEVESAYGQPMTFADLEALAAHGDTGVVRILGDLGRTIGRPLADLAVLLNPDVIVVDGTLGAAAAPVVAGIRECLQLRTPPMINEAVKVLPGQQGETAPLLGAVVLARQRQVHGLLGSPLDAEPG